MGIYGLLLCSKRFRQDYFPKINKNMQKILYLFITFTWKKDMIYEVNPEAIIDKKFVIPWFANVSFEYEASEDFAEQIKRIYISNVYRNNAFKWFAVIEFFKKPRSGYLKVRCN
jgi:hypothetical protein